MECSDTSSKRKRADIDFLSKFNKPNEANEDLENDGWGGHGGYMKAKNRKLHEQFDAINKKSNIFLGVSIWINGYTIPTSDDLKKLICENGGSFEHFFSKTKVTHVIAMNLPDSKIRKLKKNDKVVHPDWVVESIKAGKMLSLDKYLLYSATKRDGTKIGVSSRTKSPKKVEDTTIINDGVENNSVLTKPNVSNQFDSYLSDEFQENHLMRNIEPPVLLKHVYEESNVRAPPMKAGDENYIEEFYSHSRLHHLSMWKAELKRYATSIQEKWKHKKANINEIKSNEELIMHIDMDAFFVSVAIKVNPSLRGKPIAVCHSGKNKHSEDTSNSWSEIASCSYEARSFGVCNGMFLKNAKKLCPQLICVPYNFDEYRLVSQKFYEVLSGYTCEIEAVSCDEALLDITALVKHDDVLSFAEDIRQQIFNATQCHASCGIANTILIARLATRHAKPNGKCYIPRNQVSDFLASQNVKNLPGVGHILGKKLDALGITSCADLKKWLLPSLQREFGHKSGEMLYKFSRGLDERKIKTNHERKSVSAVINYGMRFTKHEEVDKFIKELSCEIEKRLKDIKKKGKQVTIRIMVRQKDAKTDPSKYMGHGICDTLSRSCNLPSPTDNPIIIAEACLKMMLPLKIQAEDYRGLGIQMSKLSDNDLCSKSNLIQFTKPVTSDELFERDRCMRVIEKENETNISSPRKNITIEKFMGVQSSTGSGKNSVSGRLDFPRLPSMDNELSKRASFNDNISFSTAMTSIQSDKNIPSHWDPKVLEELPSHIRKELLSFQNNIMHEKENGNSFKIDVGTSPSSKSDFANSVNNDDRKSPIRRGRPRKLKKSFDKGKYVTKKIDKHLFPPANIELLNRTNNQISNSNSGDDRFVTNKSNNDYHDILLSPSQMDQSVLNALPQYIIDDIMKDSKELKKMKLSKLDVDIEKISGNKVCQSQKSNDGKLLQRNKQQVNTEKVTTNQVGLDNINNEGRKDENGLNFPITSNDVTLKLGSMEENRKENVHILLSPSQIDHDVLDALPLSMQHEVITEAEKQHRLKLRETKGQLIVQNNRGDEEKYDAASEKNEIIAKHNMPMFYGLYNDKDIKKLLRDWVHAYDEPLPQDVDEILKYFHDLLLSYNMESLFKFLLFLRRTISSHSAWHTTFNQVLQSVQNDMKSFYSGSFPIAEFEVDLA